MAGSLSLSRRSLLAGCSAAAVMLVAGRALAGPASASSVIEIETAEGRAVSVTEWRPAGKLRGTILFSHGAASAPKYYGLIVSPWVAAGWRVLAPLHVDSLEHPQTAQFKGLASWKARIEDMRALVGHIGDAPFVAAGHSYGGLVATMMGGAQPVLPEGLQLPLVPRLATAVIAFSPPPVIPVLVTEQGYGALAVPALIQTGTLDILPGMTAETADGWKAHLTPFEAAAPGGQRYGLVLEGANHYFGGAICDPGQPGPQQLAPLELANQRAGLFLEGYGAGSAKARRRLDALVTDALPARLMKR
ncbi:lysophospholipase [Novosphingobium sp. P6W]|uniref:alpha/beta hydrolase family protein n=1 Tax=Novosphingobium sp. P6W TaxID=1609758 RepID=UPI0005C2CDB7|nr:lysophospholipase [Novosphingobium sp. P6W]AXB79964.1 alpha/beta hydrolase [Novosphingobium sp. P6W]KIS34475.1 lysophospholipase [Novosphingobium sp. P6W]